MQVSLFCDMCIHYFGHLSKYGCGSLEPAVVPVCLIVLFAALHLTECWSIRREAAMQDGLQRAVGVPLALAERVHVLWPYLKEMAAYGNIACKSDAQVTRKSQNVSFYVFYGLNSQSSSIFLKWSELKVTNLFKIFLLIGGSQSFGDGRFRCMLQRHHQSQRHNRWLLQGHCEFALPVCVCVRLCVWERERVTVGAWPWTLLNVCSLIFALKTRTRASALLQEAKKSASAVLQVAEEREWCLSLSDLKYLWSSDVIHTVNKKNNCHKSTLIAKNLWCFHLIFLFKWMWRWN